MPLTTGLVGTIMLLVNSVLAQNYPPCQTMGRQPGTNGASWARGATVTVILNPTDFPPGSAQRNRIEDAFRVWQNANTNSGVEFRFESGSQAPTGPAANNTYYINRQSTTTPASTSISNTGTPTSEGNITTSARTSFQPSMTNSEAIFNIMLHEIGHTFGLDHCPGCPQGSSIMTGFSVDCFCPSFPCDQNVPFNGARYGCPPLSGPRNCDENAVNDYANYPPTTTPTPTPTPDDPPPPPPPGECNQFPSVCDPPDGWSWDWCCCVSEYLLNNGSWPCTDTPVIYDSNHNGLDLSDAEHGVAFDIDANGSLDIIGWPLDPDDKFLVYDRNGNGKVDDAKELFGNKTPQPDSLSGSAQNGFFALAEFDKAENGGNGDGLFSLADSGFYLIRLWSDKHINGTSEPDELEILPADLVIELKYHVMNKHDRNGNRLRYRSGKWVWDVIFVRELFWPNRK
jgi:hypothetical protein